jgi:putative Mn2+ efflux pump MntP
VEVLKVLEIVTLALAMGIDAFTLGMGVAFKGVRLKWVMALSITVGLFHTLFPLIGMIVGHYIGAVLGQAATFAGGSLLILLGVHMIYTALWGGRDNVMNPFSLLGVLIFSISVSFDSFSVGLSLGLFAEHVAATVMIFGLFGGMSALFGLLLGRHVAGWFGKYGEMVGGGVLLAWGLKFIL